ncbi:MAG: DNA polymerase IV [Sandaracinaceae bacterium]|nr:DNA polymerase IV [Sandaracinaceae bacterium]
MRPARIVCLDLDTFFVSVERLIDPSLEGKPVIVGGAPGSRGVVTACSYEVRAHGVRSGMSLTEAARLAPDAIYLPTRHDTYGDYAAKVREIASSYTPESRVASIDEMYLDFRGCERVYARPGDADADATIERVVREITARIRAELGLPSSAGIGSSRSVAKIASGLAKPAGVRMVRAGEEAAFLAPLPVRRLPGIGPVAEGRLVGAGITTIGALAGATIATLRPILGAWAESTRARASGEGSAELGRDRPAFREHDEEGDAIGSISNERTFDADVGDPRAVEDWLASLTERVCWRARRRGVRARTITLKLRYADFSTRTRSKTTSPTHSELEVWPIVLELFAAAHTRPRARVRLVGLALSNLGHFDDQLELFERHERLHRAVDEVRARFGFDALRTARGLTVERGRGER